MGKVSKQIMAEDNKSSELTPEALQKERDDLAARLRHAQADLKAERDEAVRLRGALDSLQADKSGESWKAASEAERARADELTAKYNEAVKKVADYEAQIGDFDTRVKAEVKKAVDGVESTYRQREEAAQKKAVIEKALREAGAAEDMVDVLAGLADVSKVTIKDGKPEGFDIEQIKKARPSAFGAAKLVATTRPPDVGGVASRDGLPVGPPPKTASQRERLEYNQRLARERLAKLG